MPETHLRRREKLRELLREQDLDALLVTHLVNVRYLTGFTGSNAALLVHAADEPAGEHRTRLATDGRYTTQAAEQVPDLRVLIDQPGARVRSCPAQLLEEAAPAEHHRVGFESQHLTVERHESLLRLLENGELRAAPRLVEKLRVIKDAAEVAALRMACAAGDQALAQLLARGGLQPGRTERQVARDLDRSMAEFSAEADGRTFVSEGAGFPTIVAAGAHSAIPHHSPTDSELRQGDLVKLDFGALVDGYHSDMTRTLVLGPPADWQREIYELVATAQASASRAVADGVAGSTIDAAARDLITAAGHGAHFTHGLGHGVGLDIHEAPALSARVDDKMAAGMALTVEPGVYLPDRGGVRIEDTLLVTGSPGEHSAEGHVSPESPAPGQLSDQQPTELLTRTTKELVSV